MPKPGKKIDKASSSKIDKPKGSKGNLSSKSEQNVKILQKVNSGEIPELFMNFQDYW